MHNDFLHDEIKRSLSRIQNYIVRLESNDYYSNNSYNFLATLKKFISLVDNNLHEIPEIFYKKLLIFLNHEFVPMLRYVERSQTKHIPWSLIPNLDKIIHELLGEKFFIILRPQWHWNYTVLVADLNEILKQRASSFSGGKILFSEENKYHIITFPVLEKTNFLLHTVLGHEIGHFFQHQYFLSNLNRTKINILTNEITDQLRNEHPELDLPTCLDYSNDIITIYQGMIREIIPDLVGYYLFGPAMLFSLYFFSLWHPDTNIPSINNDYYPPLKYRIRVIYDLFYKDEFGNIVKNETNFNKTLIHFNSDLVEYLRNDQDVRLFESDLKYKKAFDLVGNEKLKIKSFLSDHKELNQKKYKVDDTIINELFDRIEKRIPPNEINNQPVLFADIFLSGWVYYLDLIKNGKVEDYSEKFHLLSKLLLKASNLIYIHSHFISKNANINQTPN